MSKFWKSFLAVFGVVAVGTTAVVISTSNNDTTDTDSTAVDSVTTFAKPPVIPMYGSNAITWYNAVGYDKEYFLQAIDSLNLDYLRVPGGTRMNDFDPRRDTCSTCPGLPYIKKMQDYTHLDIMWGLNMHLPLDVEIKWLEDAAAMGLFDKQKKNEPIVEGGNELNGASYDEALFLDGKAYGDTLKRWIPELKKHFPNMLFMAVGEDKDGKYKKTWNKDVRDRNPGVLLTCHPYPSGKFTHNGIFDSVEFRRLLDSGWVHDFGDDNIDPKTVCITEGNFTDHDKEPTSQLDTLNDDQIVIATKFWYQYWTDKQCPFINKHNLVSDNLDNYPFIDCNKKTAKLTPAGRALREFLQDKKTSYVPKLNTLYLAGAFYSDTAPYFGVYPVTFQQTWGINIGRRVVYASSWFSGSTYTDSVLLTVDWNYNHTYIKDSSKFGKKVVQIYNRLQPTMVVVENEELLHGVLSDYIKELQSASKRLGSKVTNGGVTMLELGKWYYKKTGDTGYLNRNCNAEVKAGLLAGDYDSDSTRVNQLLTAIKNLDSLRYWNVHFYFGFPQQCAGIVRCINYASTFVGKRAMSNEFGTYSALPVMFDSAVSIAKQTKMYWGIAYRGTGQIGKASAFTQTTFINAID